MTPKTYYSKLSYILLIVVFIVFFAPIIVLFTSNKINTELSLTGLFLIIIFALIVHMFYNTTYTITKTELKIKCGFISYKPISINSIKKIERSNNIISSPAASFDRIEIKYSKFEEIIISPKNKVQFAKDLVNQNPAIENKVT